MSKSSTPIQGTLQMLENSAQPRQIEAPPIVVNTTVSAGDMHEHRILPLFLLLSHHIYHRPRSIQWTLHKIMSDIVRVGWREIYPSIWTPLSGLWTPHLTSSSFDSEKKTTKSPMQIGIHMLKLRKPFYPHSIQPIPFPKRHIPNIQQVWLNISFHPHISSPHLHCCILQLHWLSLQLSNMQWHGSFREQILQLVSLVLEVMSSRGRSWRGDSRTWEKWRWFLRHRSSNRVTSLGWSILERVVHRQINRGFLWSHSGDFADEETYCYVQQTRPIRIWW